MKHGNAHVFIESGCFFNQLQDDSNGDTSIDSSPNSAFLPLIYSNNSPLLVVKPCDNIVDLGSVG